MSSYSSPSKFWLLSGLTTGAFALFGAISAAKSFADTDGVANSYDSTRNVLTTTENIDRSTALGLMTEKSTITTTWDLNAGQVCFQEATASSALLGPLHIRQKPAECRTITEGDLPQIKRSYTMRNGWNLSDDVTNPPKTKYLTPSGTRTAKLV